MFSPFAKPRVVRLDTGNEIAKSDIESRPNVGLIRNDIPMSKHMRAPSKETVKYSYIIMLLVITIVLMVYARLTTAILAISIAYIGMIIAMASRGKAKQWIHLLVLVVIFVALVASFGDPGYDAYIAAILITFFIAMVVISYLSNRSISSVI